MHINRNVGAYMQMAEEFLRDARILFDAGSYRSAASWAYYSYFDAVRALLASKSVFSKTHQAARALFGEHFVKNGPFDKSDTQNFHALFILRQNSDYDLDEILDVSAVKRGINVTTDFLIQTEAYLRENQFTS